MRVALVHSFYVSASPSGENAVVETELRALRAAGHDAELFARFSDEEMQRPLYRVRSGLRVATGHGAHPGSAVASFAPDVVHVHNLHPNISRRWLRDLRAPVVHTMHNFRAFCASGDHLRDGQVCHDCQTVGARQAIRYRCYHDSLVATAPLALRTALGVDRDPLLGVAARIIALSNQMEGQLRAAGIHPHRITQWPNFLPDHLDPGPSRVRPDPAARDGAGYLFVGRLEAAKGIDRLLHHWPRGRPLTVVGAGPLSTLVAERSRHHPDVTFLGSQPRPTVLELMQSSTALVAPSIWYEGFPLVYAEALACGLPVLATVPSSLAERVVQDGTGRGFESLEALTAWVQDGPQLPASATVRAAFDARYTEAAYIHRAERLYTSVRAEAAGRHG